MYVTAYNSLAKYSADGTYQSRVTGRRVGRDVSGTGAGGKGASKLVGDYIGATQNDAGQYIGVLNKNTLASYSTYNRSSMAAKFKSDNRISILSATWSPSTDRYYVTDSTKKLAWSGISDAASPTRLWVFTYCDNELQS